MPHSTIRILDAMIKKQGLFAQTLAWKLSTNACKRSSLTTGNLSLSLTKKKHTHGIAEIHNSHKLQAYQRNIKAL